MFLISLLVRHRNPTKMNALAHAKRKTQFNKPLFSLQFW